MDNRFAALKTNVFKTKNSRNTNKDVKTENTFKKKNNFKPKKRQQTYNNNNNKFMSFTDNYYQKEEPKKEFELKSDDFPTLG
tara:strand:+ start:10620 stop:10865 length:246 start_codon:yes stop_codon:yes gene_type:complete